MKKIPREALENFSEDALTVSFDCSFEVVRKAKVAAGLKPEQPVSVECLKEIRLLTTAITIDHAAHRYNCTTADVLRAYYNRRPRNNLKYYTLNELKPWFATGLPFETLAETLNCSVRHLQANFKEVRKELTGRDRLSEQAKDELLNALMNKEGTQAELADKFGVSQSTVSRLKPDRQKRKAYNFLSEEDWAKLISEVKTRKLSISEASRVYNISRPSIYQRLKEDK